MKTIVSISVVLAAGVLASCKPAAAPTQAAAAPEAAPAAAPTAAPAAAPATTLAAAPAAAMPTERMARGFVGSWAFAGEIVGPRGTVTSAPICTFTRAAGGLEGSCRGPSAEGTAAVQVNGNAIDIIYSHHAIRVDGVTGVTEFRGILGGDGVIRGREETSVMRGRVGRFTAQRVG